MKPCSLVDFTKVSEKNAPSVPEHRCINNSTERLNLPVSTDPIEDHSINIRGNINFILKKRTKNLLTLPGFEPPIIHTVA
jgi:hypothetical protein